MKQDQAKPFKETRTHHLSELAEDYVEIIYDLILEKSEARVKDIAEHLGVSHVTVIRTLARLKAKGYIYTQKHMPITLSDEGIALAKQCKERHTFLLGYLKALGVPEHIAQIDVEGMEHHISPQTMQCFKAHLNQIQGIPDKV
ncbi:MAG: helix-turn-helix domain-containing protein [Chlamydiales bacterium]|nr:helix-turn-helix domain-containing protein [Chlamydiales bacterium]